MRKRSAIAFTFINISMFKCLLIFETDLDQGLECFDFFVVSCWLKFLSPLYRIFTDTPVIRAAVFFAVSELYKLGF